MGQKLFYGGIEDGVLKKELGPMEVDNLSQKSEKMVNREMVQ